jgi:hypothetical protein
MRLRREIVAYLGCDETHLDFCSLCRLPPPAGDFEAYAFCPWCDRSRSAGPPRAADDEFLIELPFRV